MLITPSDSQFWEESILFIVYRPKNVNIFKLNENLFLVHKIII